MSTPKTTGGPVDQQRLDKLVDGELPERERHELLTSFDSHPEAWRRCALAFLEAQCWSKEFDSFAGGPDRETAVAPQSKPKQPGRTPKSRARKLPGRTATALAMAASFLLALWMGWSIQDAVRLSTVPVPGPSDLAQVSPVPEVVDPVAPPEWGPLQRPSSPSSPWQMVTLSANGPDGQHAGTFELPACEQQRLDSRWPNSLPPALPSDVMESLERLGYRVRQQRELLPIEMQDGRRLIVPVEEVQVEYVGQPSL